MKDNVYIMENMIKIRINSSGTAKAKGLIIPPLVSEFSIAPECKTQCFSGVFLCCGRLSKTLALQAENPGSSPGRSSNIFKSNERHRAIYGAFFIFRSPVELALTLDRQHNSNI